LIYRNVAARRWGYTMIVPGDLLRFEGNWRPQPSGMLLRLGPLPICWVNEG
jgi:hypothetical protein